MLSRGNPTGGPFSDVPIYRIYSDIVLGVIFTVRSENQMFKSITTVFCYGKILYNVCFLCCSILLQCTKEHRRSPRKTLYTWAPVAYERFSLMHTLSSQRLKYSGVFFTVVNLLFTATAYVQVFLASVGNIGKSQIEHACFGNGRKSEPRCEQLKNK